MKSTNTSGTDANPFLSVPPRGVDAPVPADPRSRSRGKTFNTCGRRQTPLAQPPHYRTGGQVLERPVERSARFAREVAL